MRKVALIATVSTVLTIPVMAAQQWYLMGSIISVQGRTAFEDNNCGLANMSPAQAYEQYQSSDPKIIDKDNGRVDVVIHPFAAQEVTISYFRTQENCMTELNSVKNSLEQAKSQHEKALEKYR